MLSRLAREFAAEIRQHDWSDAPWRIDRAGHDRQIDTKAGDEQLSPRETDNVRLNVAWVTAQVLGHADPNLNITEFADACGVLEDRAGILKAGLRAWNGRYAKPGTYDYDEDNTDPSSANDTPANAGTTSTPDDRRRSGVLKATLDIDTETTWADLRRFVELGAHEADDEKLFIEYDPFGNGDIQGLSVYTSV